MIHTITANSFGTGVMTRSVLADRAGIARTDPDGFQTNDKPEKLDADRLKDGLKSVINNQKGNIGSGLVVGFCAFMGAALATGATMALTGPVGIAARLIVGTGSGGALGALIGYGPRQGFYYESGAKAGALIGAVVGAGISLACGAANPVMGVVSLISGLIGGGMLGCKLTEQEGTNP